MQYTRDVGHFQAIFLIIWPLDIGDFVSNHARVMHESPGWCHLILGDVYFCHPKDTLEKKETSTEYGHWEFYKCNFQNRFVSCVVDNVEYYLDSAKCQLHNPVYLTKQNLVHHHQSEKNPGRLYLQYSKRWCQFFQWVDQVFDRVSYVLETVQNCFLTIKDYESYLLWVIIDYLGVPPSFFILSSFKGRILNSFWLDTDKNHRPMMLWTQAIATNLSIFYGFFYWIDCESIWLLQRTSEAGIDETDHGTLPSLVGNFPCMPQSPAFTHSSPEGWGLGLLSRFRFIFRSGNSFCSIEWFCSPIFEVYDGDTYFRHI